MKKISEIIEYKKVRRPKKDSSGNRIYEDIEFEYKYNPNIQNDSIRVLAKIIDICLVIIIISILANYKLIDINTFLISFPFILIVINSILESLIGSSFGKLILWVEIVNDNCKKLNMYDSLKRNILVYVIIFSYIFIDNYNGTRLEYYNKKMNAFFYYVISKSNKTKIIDKMKQ